MNKMNGKLKLWLIVTLCCALVAFSVPLFTTTFGAETERPLVIVLDPGHGGPDFGAINKVSGLYESEINLKIALACRDELEKYDGVTVCMTHTGLDPSGAKMTLGERVDYAYSVDADILISLHTNDAKNAGASGSEVFVSHSTYKSEYNQKSTELAISFLRQFRKLGMSIRGVKTRLSNGARQYYHSDGTNEIGDYYAVIGDTIKRYAIPGILVEHGFIKGDSTCFDTDEELAAFGIADATAIAEYYGLSLKADLGSDDDARVPEPVLLTDDEREEASAVAQLVVKLPLEIDLASEASITKARLRYESLTADQKSVLESDIAETLYYCVLQLEELKHPVRLEVSEDNETLFINRIDYTLTGVAPSVLGSKGTTAAELKDDLRILFDADAAAAYSRDIASQEAISEAQLVTATDITGALPVLEGARLEEKAERLTAEILDSSRYTFTVRDVNGRELTSSELVGTGCTVELCRDSIAVESLTVLILGDISGDGIIDSLDNLLLTRHVSGLEELSGAGLLAADLNSDSMLDSHDEALLSGRIVSEK